MNDICSTKKENSNEWEKNLEKFQPTFLKIHYVIYKFCIRNIKIFVEDRLPCLSFLLRSFSLFSKFEIYCCKIVLPYFYNYLFRNTFSLIYVLNGLKKTLFI